MDARITQAYVVERQGAPFVLRDVVLDGIRDDEVLVEMAYTGLCHTDLVVQQGGMPVGRFPAVLGHEGVGTALQVGARVPDRHLAAGDTVLLTFHTCRQCAACRGGQQGGCPHMTEINFVQTARQRYHANDGGCPPSPLALPDGTPVHGQFFGQSSLSRRAVVAGASVVRLPAARPADLPFLAPLACGYLTGAGTVLSVLRPGPGSRVVVLGMGAVGLAALLAARARGVADDALVAVDVVDAKLALAAELGAAHTINTSALPGGLDLAAAVRAVLPGGADCIVDATGVPALHAPAVRALAHGGTLALVGVPPPSASLQVNTLDLLTSCKRIVGVIEGQANPQELIPELLQLYHDGRFPIDRLSTCYPAAALNQAIADLSRGTVIKPILSWRDME